MRASEVSAILIFHRRQDRYGLIISDNPKSRLLKLHAKQGSTACDFAAYGKHGNNRTDSGSLAFVETRMPVDAVPSSDDFLYWALLC